MDITLKKVHTTPNMIQIHNVPDQIHRRLKSRAALTGKSLSDFPGEELAVIAALSSEAELRAQLADAEPFAMTDSSAAIIRSRSE